METDKIEQPKELDKVERAEIAVKKMEEVEKRLDEKIAKLTDLQADRLLGSTAGAHVDTKPKEESPQDYAKRISAGKI
jgi:hypothetical protein